MIENDGSKRKLLPFYAANRISYQDTFGTINSRIHGIDIVDSTLMVSTTGGTILIDKSWLVKQESNGKVLKFTRMSGDYAMQAELAA